MPDPSFCTLEECSGGADMYVAGGLVRLPPFAAAMQRCNAPASNGVQRSGSWTLLGAAGHSDVGAA